MYHAVLNLSIFVKHFFGENMRFLYFREKQLNFLKGVSNILGKIFAIISSISLFFAILTGNLTELAGSILDGASKAVTLTIALIGIMGLWNGVMRVLDDIGVCRIIAKLISPLLRIVFPSSYKKGVAMNEIATNISANLLGLGNAATPIGIKAMEALSEANDGSDTASDDMVTFVVMNTCAISFMPTTLIALRRAAGSENPFSILVPVWICSTVCMTIAILFAKMFSVFSRPKKEKRHEKSGILPRHSSAP